MHENIKMLNTYETSLVIVKLFHYILQIPVSLSVMYVEFTKLFFGNIK